MVLHVEIHSIPNVLRVQLCNLINSTEVDAGAFCALLKLAAKWSEVAV